MIIRKALALLTLLIASTLHAGTVSDSSAALESIGSFIDTTVLLKADFDIEINWEARDKIEHNSGSMILAPGNRFAVSLGGTTYTSNGATMWQYRKKGNQVLIRSLSAIDNRQLPQSLLRNYLSNRCITATRRSGKLVVATLCSPPDTGVKRPALVEVSLNRESRKVVSVRIDEHRGAISTYTISSLKRGGTPDAKTFSFTVPRGATITDER